MIGFQETHLIRPLTADELGLRWHPLPQAVANRWFADMRVADFIDTCAVFLGHKNMRDEFIPHGTAFVSTINKYQHTYFYVVTAKHVIDQIPTDNIVLRVNTISKSGVRYVPIPKGDWLFHPQHDEKSNYIDVAVAKEKFDITDLDFTVFTRETFASQYFINRYKIGIGDEVVTAGLFLSYIGRTRNLSLARIGNIAAMPKEPVPTDHGMVEAYLIESRSIGGLSGSPVFVHLAVRPDRTKAEIQPYPNVEDVLLEKTQDHYLLGLVQGYYSISTQEEWVVKTTQLAGDMNTGISIVVPISKIAETIDQDALAGRDAQEARAELEGTIRASGAKSASAAVPDDNVNPHHREDFTSLLNAAARKKPQDGQTSSDANGGNFGDS